MFFKTKPLIIDDSPKVIRTFLSKLKNDKHFSKAFDGSMADGEITGFYGTFSKSNIVPIGYTKVDGKYDLASGRLEVRTAPSILFWFIAIALTVGILTTAFTGGSTIEVLRLTAVVVLFLLGYTLVIYFENRSFIKHMKRVYFESIS